MQIVRRVWTAVAERSGDTGLAAALTNPKRCRRFALPPQSIYILVVILVTGCCGFDRDWNRAAQGLPTGDALAGRWHGHWMSERNGHNGRLRCIVKPATNGIYDARFHAKYWKILSFGYTAPLRVQTSNSITRFEGEANLGKLAGGVYHYKGAVTGTNWQSTYQSRYDHGYFRMNRVP